jgi:hypothetical protein
LKHFLLSKTGFGLVSLLLALVGSFLSERSGELANADGKLTVKNKEFE